MASNALTTGQRAAPAPSRAVQTTTAGQRLARLLMPLASLRLTVVLFAMAIFLIFAGTLAQVDKDIWEVVDQYFRTFFAWISFQVFFPQAFFSGAPPKVPGGFYFPGGWLIGGAMGINLLAAHALRFKVQARGPRLAVGLAVIAVGALLTWMVVVGGSGKDTIEGAAPFAWSTMWTVIQWLLVGCWLAGAWALARLDRSRKIERWGLAVAEAVLCGVLAWIFLRSDGAALGDSSMRILWQLTKGGLAGLVLLAGCVLLFRKRAGIVLLHAGIALVMANELVVHSLHVETQMQIREGETINFVQDSRTVELAVIDPSDPKTVDVVVVPRSLLTSDELIHDANLPFDVQVDKYLKNSELKPIGSDKKNLATAGAGLKLTAEPRRAGTGTDTGGNVDRTAAYVTLLDKQSHEPIGTYLVSIELQPQDVKLGDKTYELALRFKRTYKPYAMRLEDVRFDKYLGTQTAKNYSSDLRLTDATRGVDRDVKIWMNNPLRFAGETFYQSSYFDDGQREGTVLQVVSNAGWMIPYVACMLVAIGMLAQFSITLVRFLNRRDSELAAAAVESVTTRKLGRRPASIVQSSWSVPGVWLPVSVALLAAMYVAYAAWPKHVPLSQMQIDEFGRLPVVYEGRAKPLDTVARNMLRYLSLKQEFIDESTSPARRAPAIKWFLDVVARPEVAVKHKVIRIDNLELLAMLGLERRQGYRYAIDEFSKHFEELERQAELATSREASQLTIYEKKLVELVKKLRLVRLLGLSFDPPTIDHEKPRESLDAAMRQLSALERMQPVLAVPPASEDAKWETFAAAWFEGLKDRVRNREPNPAMVSMTTLIVDYGKNDVEGFNSELAKYENWLGQHKPEGFDTRKISFEDYFNHFEPFYWALVLYVAAFVVVALSWLGWTQPLNRAAFWLIVVALGVHTFALVSRIYISGRPPVTNLYSSAVFIGWGGVVLGLVFEMIYRLGIGNVIAAVAGFTTLLIANFLAGLTDGDTLGVLQAVLDTQFWLATHVVCETLGYSTTYIAGLLGLIYIGRGVLTSSLSPEVGKDLARMIYGTLCFAIFFSFVGTVLGGLWADDSWGRFWGWDPKENGALIIVLWNALVLHARWGGMVRERGLAALAVLGNIVVSWSWFGVNELGVGLHSYGFTEGVMLMLGIFVLTQLGAVALAMIPRDRWLSSGGPTGA